MTWEILTSSIKDIAAVVAAVGALIVAYYGIAKGVARFRVWLSNTAICRAINLLLEQLQRNGGKSIYDRITQIADSLQEARDERKEMQQNIQRITSDLSVVSAITLQLMDHFDEAFYLCDQAGECTYANPALCDLFGMDRDDMKGSGWLGAIDETERSRVWGWWQEAIAKNLPYSTTYTIINQRTGKRTAARTTAERCKQGPDGVTIHVGVVTLAKKRASDARTRAETGDD